MTADCGRSVVVSELLIRIIVGFMPVLVLLGSLIWLDSYKLIPLRRVLLLILAGQPQLLAKLALRVHLPFRQRVAMRYRMPPMDEAHTRGYIDHQMRLAGRRQRLFTDEALLQLFVQSGGIPRAIGNLALAAMYHAAAQGKDLVELDEVVTASKEVV